jgi:hypothetical protein
MPDSRRSFFGILSELFEKPISNESISSQTVEVKHHSRISVNPENIKQSIIIGYCLVILFESLYVPWKEVTYLRHGDNAISGSFRLGYSFLFSSPGVYGAASIDYGLVILEIIATTVIAIILYVLKDRLSILINHMINLDR